MTLPCMEWLHQWVPTQGGYYCAHCGCVMPHTYATDSARAPEARDEAQASTEATLTTTRERE
jgi:transcription initiation factor TFIIIB Brf1 subunit/transcription initiation factor TFIIB